MKPAHVLAPISGTPMGNFAIGAAEMAVAATHRAIRIVFRLAGAGALAGVAGIVIGALATGGGLVQLLVTAFAAFALWIPAFMLLTGVERWREGRRRRAVQVQEQRRFAPVGGGSWSRLEGLGGRRADEIRALRSQLARTHAALPAQSLDPQVHELRILIEKRVPQLIDSGLACLPENSASRSAAVDELVDLVGRFAADSRQREQRLIGTLHEHQTVRRRIEDHLEHDRSPVS